MVSKNILTQYCDLCKEYTELQEKISKLEEQIQKITANGTVIDTVSGGLGGIQTFKIEGVPYPELSRKKTLLYSRKAILSELEMQILENINEVEKFISSINDSHIRRIVTLRIVDGLSWNKIADKMGGFNTEDSVKKAFYRYVDNNK